MVAIGLQTVFGLGEESTFGTAVAPTRFHPIISESLKLEKKTLDDPSMYPSSGYQAVRDTNRVVTGRSASGDFKLGVTTKSMGLLFKHSLGPLLTPAVTSLGGSPAAYLHTYLPGLAKTKSLTLQKQLRDNAGTLIAAFDYSGVKITKLELSIDTNGILQASVSVDARDEQKNGSPATASYGTGRPFHFMQGLVKLAGSQVTDVIKNVSLSIERPLDTERIGIGNQGLKSEQSENDLLKVSGKATVEFENAATVYDRFTADTGLEFILQFVGSTISGANKEQLTITLPVVHFDGDTPQAGGPGTITHDAPFTAYWDGTLPSIKVEYQTVDSAP